MPLSFCGATVNIAAMSNASDSIPPIGAAPENEDFQHPWIISAIVSALCFGAGFVLLYTSRIWSNVCQWADWPFLIYTAILTPVLMGFYTYGVYRVLELLFRRKTK